MNDSRIPSKLYNDKLNVKEMSSFSGWKLLSLHPPIPASLSLCPPVLLKLGVFKGITFIYSAPLIEPLLILLTLK